MSYNNHNQENPITIDDVITMIKEQGTLGAGGIWTASIVMTPQMAQALLDNNPINRNISEDRVHEMCEAMRAGRWRANGSSISITDTGKMGNGQHRCTGCVRTGIPIPVVMVYGIEEEIDVLGTIDTGGSRRVTDIITISNKHNPTTAASVSSKTIAVSNILIEITDGVDILSTDRQAKAEFAMANAEEIQPWISWADPLSLQSARVSVGKSRVIGVRSVGATALATLGLHLFREGADPDTINEFYQGVVDPWSLPGETLRSMTENRRMLLEALHRRTRQTPLNRSTGGGSIKPLMVEFGAHITAYNRYVLNEPVQLVRASKETYRYLSDLPPVIPGPKRHVTASRLPAGNR